MALKRYQTTQETSLSVAMSSGDTAVNVVDGSSYPDPAAPGNDTYTLIVGYGSSREEVCTVTAKPSANVLTVTRAQDGTSATSKNIGDVVVHGVSTRDFEAMLQKTGGTMSGFITLHADPSSAMHPSTKQYVDSQAIAVGTITMFGGNAAPSGWHLCNGTPHGSSALQAVIGSANTPDLRDRFIVASGSTYAVGNTGGLDSVTLSSAQSGMPSHTHTASSGNESATHTHSVDPASATTSSATPAITMNRDTGIENGAELTGTGVNYITDGSGLGSGGTPMSATQAAHTHTLDIPATTSATESVSHTHTITVASSATASAASSHENRPPYYALTFIVKK